LLEVGEDRVGFDQVFVRLGFTGVAGQALDAVDRKGPTPTSESGTLHRWNDEAYSPPVVPMATGFGDLTNECESCLLICRRLRIRKTVFMAVVRGRPSGLPVTRFRFANLRTAATPFRLATICWQSQQTKRGFNYG